MNVLVKLQHGSRLYGTSISTSDQDYRGIYLPKRCECYLNRIKDTITDASEEDTQYFSLQYFMQLAAQGQSIAIEMLAAPYATSIIKQTPIWQKLRAERKRFYTKNMHSFLGFAKSMAGKYSSRSERLDEVNQVLRVIKDHLNRVIDAHAREPRLGDIWDELPTSVNAEKTTNDRSSAADKRVYRICGREIQAAVYLSNAHSVISAIAESYGARVRAAKDGNIDFKSVAHAFRVALQAKEIVETGDLIYPLKDAAYLRDMRLGKIDFLAHSLDKQLDDLITEVQAKMDASDLPDKVDTAWCEAFVLGAYA